MVNWMSDKDLALESGDARTCEHCGEFYWVDEWHSCAEGSKASRDKSEAFSRKWEGTGKRRITTVVITLNTPDSDMAANSALDYATNGLFGDEGSDDVLDVSWKVERKVETK